MKSYKKIVDNIKSLYNQDYSKKYRKSDEEEVENQSVKFICQLLEELTNSLQQNNTLALDIGCGTGRYFYCLKNIKKLIAVDVSPYMIEEAKNPVNKELITIDDIELICK
ncbi:MAG: methyltransferase domain-containing protein, partial [Endomicrobia bacterium]|nr:methyltransferase domain-containing protein [Endomicrobiia bacterium]